MKVLARVGTAMTKREIKRGSRPCRCLEEEGKLDGIGSIEWQAFAAWSSSVGGDGVIETVCMAANVRFLGVDRLRPNKSDKRALDTRKNTEKSKKTCVDTYGYCVIPA